MEKTKNLVGYTSKRSGQPLPKHDAKVAEDLRRISDTYWCSSDARDFGYHNVRMSTAVESWHQSFKKLLPSKSPPAEVVMGRFQDATELFGPTMNRKLTLRHASQLGIRQLRQEIVLVQFDPNFATNVVVCRHPSCGKANPRGMVRGMGKRDLYLCPEHRALLTNYIIDSCAKQNVKFAPASHAPSPGCFDGYTSLIAQLEAAYYDAKLSPRSLPPNVEEAILNVRNFLIITSTLLNPDEDNLGIALPPVLSILELILENYSGTAFLLAALSLVLREVIETILFAFGVVYTWVSLALQSPGAQIGAGVGALLGTAGFIIGPWGGAAGMSMGAVIGGLIGNGVYSLKRESRLEQMQEFREFWVAANAQVVNQVANAQPNQYHGFHVEGDALGGLDVHAFQANQ